jgi:hypothetical protein
MVNVSQFVVLLSTAALSHGRPGSTVMAVVLRATIKEMHYIL